jgi:hypothetical protein
MAILTPAKGLVRLPVQTRPAAAVCRDNRPLSMFLKDIWVPEQIAGAFSALLSEIGMGNGRGRVLSGFSVCCVQSAAQFLGGKVFAIPLLSSLMSDSGSELIRFRIMSEAYPRPLIQFYVRTWDPRPFLVATCSYPKLYAQRLDLATSRGH